MRGFDFDNYKISVSRANRSLLKTQSRSSMTE